MDEDIDTAIEELQKIDALHRNWLDWTGTPDSHIATLGFYTVIKSRLEERQVKSLAARVILMRAVDLQIAVSMRQADINFE